MTMWTRTSRSGWLALGTAVLAWLVVATPSASAQPVSKSRKPRGVITLAEITITGRIQKPIAAVDVSRLQPELMLSELRQPFLARIGEAVYKEPF